MLRSSTSGVGSAASRGDAAHFEQLRRVFASAWNRRLSPQQWGRAVKDHFGPRCAASPLLCDFLLQQARVGPSPSPLLLSYIRHALTSGLITKAHFFNALCDVASPAASLQFSAFLQLVTEFAPLMITHEEREELRRTMIKEQSKLKRKRTLSESQSQLSDSMELETDTPISTSKKSKPATSMDVEANAATLEEKQREPTNDISLIARTFLKLADMLVSGIAYCLAPDTNSAIALNKDQDQLTQQHNESNLERCIHSLVALLVEHKSLAYILLARHDHPDIWSSFCSKCETLYKSTERTAPALGPTTTLANSRKHILKPLWHALQGLLSSEYFRLSCCSWLKHNLFTNIALHNSNAYNRPWLAIALIVKEEQTSVQHRTLAESAERLKGLRGCRGLGWYAFLCELWSAALRYYNSKRGAVGSREWYIARNYLLVKIPLLMQQWSDMADAERTFLMPPQLSNFNPVELSLLHLSHFPTLISPPTDVTSADGKSRTSASSPLPSPSSSQSVLSPSSQHAASTGLSGSQPLPHQATISTPSFNLPAAWSTLGIVPTDTSTSAALSLAELINACQIRGLVSKDKLEPHLKGLVIPPFPTEVYTLEAMLAGAQPQRKEDVDQLFGFLRNKDLGDEVIQAALNIIGSLHQNQQTQELLIEAILQSTDPFQPTVKEEAGTISHALLAQIFTTLCSDSILDTLFLHSALPQLAGNVAVYCERWTPDDETPSDTRQEALSRFSSAFILLIAIFEKLEIKSIVSNQLAIQRTQGFRHLANEASESGSTENETAMKKERSQKTFLVWYYQYLFSKFDLSSPSKAQTGDVLLRAVFATTPGQTIKDVVDKLNPWETLELLPYVAQQLYLGSIHKKISLTTLYSHYKLLLDTIPYASIPLYMWLSKELLVSIQQTSMAGASPGQSHQISVPMLILSNLFETHAPTAKILSAIGTGLKKAVEASPDNPVVEKVKAVLHSIPSTKHTLSFPIASHVSKEFLNALPETMPSTSFSHLSFILSRVGKREFCGHVLRGIINSLHGGMGSRHALRAAEMGACLIALCGGKELVSVHFSQCLPLCPFGLRTQFYGQLVAYMSVLSAALTGMHLVPQTPEGKQKSPEEIALYGLFEYITEMLERMIEQPTSSLPFALTFLCLATATPSIFRFAPALRLATALERLGAYQLLFCIYLPPPSRLFTGSDANAVDAHASRMIEVLRNVVANKNFGQTQELCLE